ncbi:hypothetical protein [Vibrio harveyi]|uniref:hypothetical protein n=1 Tax=Vibrio harveyi TaxID=669 RepID=UPI00067FED3C|nr:hypothetical protein [Vibrio harveyi]MBM4805911.1 hypothetical protein [Vibrio parahaemolyticus]PNM41314.1 hypothetical protein AL469_014620 [Vibrio harveyi]HAS6883009.1 hypothetical protein [Vibrio parahaemolyticus]
MNNQDIKPEKITKPLQLLGAWLAGLFSINSCFLVAASNMEQDSIGSLLLIGAAIINVPIFLVAVFVLQTKFRPEMQEDQYYSIYLSSKTNQKVYVPKSERNLKELEKQFVTLNTRLSSFIERDVKEQLKETKFAINECLILSGTYEANLKAYGVKTVNLFGSENSPLTEIVAISTYLPNELQEEVIALVKQLGFKQYAYFDNVDEESEEMVIIGAYGTEHVVDIA